MLSQQLISWIKDRKTWWMATQPEGDMCPIVVGLTNGKPVIVATSPQQDKQCGLYAASLVMSAFRPDIVVFIADAHIDHATTLEEHNTRYPKGMQHACDDEHACETSSLSDCMLANIMAQDHTGIITIPYKYHDKGKRRVAWTDDRIHNSLIDGAFLQGAVVEDLRDSLIQAPLHNSLMRMVARSLRLNPNSPRFRHHTQRAVERALSDQGFTVEHDMEYRCSIYDQSGIPQLMNV